MRRSRAADGGVVPSCVLQSPDSLQSRGCFGVTGHGSRSLALGRRSLARPRRRRPPQDRRKIRKVRTAQDQPLAANLQTAGAGPPGRLRWSDAVIRRPALVRTPQYRLYSTCQLSNDLKPSYIQMGIPIPNPLSVQHTLQTCSSLGAPQGDETHFTSLYKMRFVLYTCRAVFHLGIA